MLIAGCLKYSSGGRVIVTTTGPVVNFNGGTPTNAAGAVVVSGDVPEVYLNGFGYMRNQPICTREIVPQSYEGGLGRDSVGRLALALLEPIAGFIAGIPVVADGRVAVAFDGPPPNIHAFDNGFDQQAFS